MNFKKYWKHYLFVLSLLNAYREAIAFLIIAILSVMSLANSVVDDESCDIDTDGCVDREIK